MTMVTIIILITNMSIRVFLATSLFKFIYVFRSCHSSKTVTQYQILIRNLTTELSRSASSMAQLVEALMLQAQMSRVRLPMVSLRFLIDLIFPAASNKNEYQ